MLLNVNSICSDALFEVKPLLFTFTFYKNCENSIILFLITYLEYLGELHGIALSASPFATLEICSSNLGARLNFFVIFFIVSSHGGLISMGKEDDVTESYSLAHVISRS